MSSATSRLPTISRETLRGLKAQKEEERRQENIGGIVMNIYRQVVQVASTTTDTSYAYPFPKSDHWQAREKKAAKKTFDGTPIGDNEPFFMDNIEDIIEKLQALFPDCAIRYTGLVTAQNGKKYDTSTLDEAMLSFINRDSEHLHLIIDWS